MLGNFDLEFMGGKIRVDIHVEFLEREKGVELLKALVGGDKLEKSVLESRRAAP